MQILFGPIYYDRVDFEHDLWGISLLRYQSSTNDPKAVQDLSKFVLTAFFYFFGPKLVIGLRDKLSIVWSPLNGFLCAVL